MRRVLVIVAMLGLAAQLVHADPNIPWGGALIAHCTGPWGRYPEPNCETYFQYNPITNCDDQVNTMDDGQYVWFVIAAFEEDKVWCVVQFGFNDYDPDIMAFGNCGPCFPQYGLEYPSAHWPGPLEGTTFFVPAYAPWTGNWLPVYGFIAYTYHRSGVVQLIPDPTAPVPFGGFSTCATTPSAQYDAALGGMGVGEPGTWVCPGMVDAVCCVGEDCVIVHSEAECSALGGVLRPEWNSCGPPDPCGVTPTTAASWARIKSIYR